MEGGREGKGRRDCVCVREREMKRKRDEESDMKRAMREVWEGGRPKRERRRERERERATRNEIERRHYSKL